VSEHAKQDTEYEWGFVNSCGVFVRLPKLPMLRRGLGPPPFTVECAFGTRYIVEGTARIGFQHMPSGEI
jgi:hypothetical protein